MDLFDYAMKMEKDGEQFYRKLAGKSPDPGLARLLTMLADQEVRHFQTFQAMKRNEEVQVDQGTFRDDAKNIFQKLAESDKQADFSESEIDLYRRAQQIEKESRDFYLAKAEEVGSDAAKQALLKIAEEERLHYLMLGTMIEFVSRPEPGRWLENAEWYQTDEH